ncbi:8747_t:CDS:2, partial [Racocetra fulgida]
MYVEVDCDGDPKGKEYPHDDNRYTYLNITVSTPQNLQAIGKLVFNDDNGHHEELIGKDAIWVYDAQ